MARCGIDVSKHNGNVDWKKVKSQGFDFACIKIIKKDLSKDERFEANWTGCTNAKVDIYGVYNYSYATTVSKAITDASAVVKALGDRKTIVWMDVEDSCQKGLKGVLIDIILAYKEVIESSGNRFGIYTGDVFYKSYIKPYISKLKDVKFWIARYGKNDGVRNVSYQPQISNMVAWQYSSKAKVVGVGSTYTDVNVSYDDDWFKGKSKSTDSAKKETVNYPEPTRVLKYKIPNMKGNDVKWVQYYLIKKGFLAEKNNGKGNIDGVFGKDTKAAVINFQRASKIATDGIVGKDTVKYLKK